MTPIEGLSNDRRLPRLGKIRLGIKVPNKNGQGTHPEAVDYFVVPDQIKSVVGDEPKVLNIVFPSDDMEQVAAQYMRAYSFTQGCTCKGDGIKATRKIDIRTGAIASGETEEWIFKEGLACDPKTCPEAAAKKCRRVMQLQFLMPMVPGFGVWQIDSSSIYSILNVNSCLDLVRNLCGRVSFIPLQLILEPMTVSPPGIKTKTVHVLSIRTTMTLQQVSGLAKLPPAQSFLAPPVVEDEAPEDLFPPDGFEEDHPPAAALAAPAAAGAPAKPPPPAPIYQGKTPADVSQEELPDLLSVSRWAFGFWKMQPADIAKELGYKTLPEVVRARISPWQAWQTVLAVKQIK